MAWLADKAIDGYGNKLQLYAEEIEVSTEGNYSRIHAWLDLNVVSGGSVASSGMVAKVTGGENNIGYHYYGSGTHRLVDGYFYVTHASDGSGSAYVEGSFSAYIGSWGLSGTLWLTKISRYPYLNSGKNFKDNENPVFDITGSYHAEGVDIIYIFRTFDFAYGYHVFISELMAYDASVGNS